MRNTYIKKLRLCNLCERMKLNPSLSHTRKTEKTYSMQYRKTVKVEKILMSRMWKTRKSTCNDKMESTFNEDEVAIRRAARGGM